MAERKYRKVVNRNGWMRKLHQFSFGDSAPHFVGYCPFFWFTWLCILLMPVILPGTLFIFLLRGIGRGVVSVAEMLPERGLRRPSDYHLIAFYDDMVNGGLDYAIDVCSGISPVWDNMIAWVKVTSDWENCAKRAIVKRDAAKLKASNREKRVKALANYAAPIAKTILIAAGTFGTGLALYWFQKLIIKIRWYEVWDAFVGALPYVGWAILFVAGTLVVVYFAVEVIARLIARFRRCPKCPEKVTIWMKIGRGIIAALEFCIETIESVYAQECPLIEYSDHSEPIQPRK